MKRCLYCNAKTETPVVAKFENEKFFCCGEECLNKTLAFLEFAKRNTKYFLIGVIACPAVFMFGSLFPFSAGNNFIGSVLFCIGWSSVGLSLFAFPFATPQTSQLFGLRNAVRIVKILGIAVIALTPLFWMMLRSG